MRLFIILALTLSYTNATTDCIRREFPNYFAELPAGDAKQLINESLGAILDRLEVPRLF